MRALILLGSVAFVQDALAHDAPASHAHPHGDWTLAGLGVLAIGLLAAALLPALKARRERNRK